MMGELVLKFSTANPSCFLNFYLQPHLSTEHHLILPLFFLPSSCSYATLLCATTTCYTSFLSLILASLYLCTFFISSWRGRLYLHPEELAAGIPTTLCLCSCVCVCFILFSLVPQWAEVYGTLQLARPCLQCYFYACECLHVRISVCACMQIWVHKT